MDIVTEAKLYNEKLIARFLINMIMPNTIMGREVLEALEDMKISILDSQIGARAAFKNALVSGQGVIEYDPKSKAALEMTACYHEILKLGET